MMMVVTEGKKTFFLFSLSLFSLPPLELADVLYARLVVLHDLREQERERREVELVEFCMEFFFFRVKPSESKKHFLIFLGTIDHC